MRRKREEGKRRRGERKASLVTEMTHKKINHKCRKWYNQKVNDIPRETQNMRERC